MCGILGIFNHSRSRNIVAPDILERMTDVINHRGPDDAGTYISSDERIGFGFRRLSIIDLSAAGHQPMSNPEGTIWMVFNGEVYNHAELRKDLEKKGYVYRSHTDTETILYAYQEYGIEFLSKLYGMFAIAIWDTRIEKLLVVRDRVGVKPVYYTEASGAFFFASEIKSLLKHPAIAQRLNPQGLYDYLSFYITPPGQTFFDGIYKLEAGHFLTVDASGVISKHRFWDVDNETISYDPKDLRSEEFCTRHLLSLLRDSVRLRMVSDVPFGVLLSGGVDSSLNVALMSELMDRPVQTFTAGFADLNAENELHHARQVSQMFGTNHHEVIIDHNDTRDFVPQMAWHQDEPNADPACVPMYFVSRLARRSGTIVVQVGEGADEEFAGYRHYLQELQYYRYYYRLPRLFHMLAAPASRLLPVPHTIREYIHRAREHRVPFFYGGIPTFGERYKRTILRDEFLDGLETSDRIPWRYLQAYADISPTREINHLRAMTYYEFKHRLSELLLMRVDKMSMASSIEARVPFLDHRIVEFSFRVPNELKVRNGVGKYLLKKAAEGILPDSIIYRAKQGLNSPVSAWLRQPSFFAFAKESILDSPLIASTFKEQTLIDMFKTSDNISTYQAKSIWSLLVLAQWNSQYTLQP